VRGQRKGDMKKKTPQKQPPTLEASPFELAGREVRLSGPDEAYLGEREEIIEQGRETFLAVGRALLEIREYRAGVLFKDTYGSFEAYIRERWEFGRSYAYRLMNAAEVVDQLSPRGDSSAAAQPVSEKQIRTLTLLEDAADRRRAWDEARKEAGDAEVTSAMISKTVRRMIADGAKKRTPEKRRSKPRTRNVQITTVALGTIRRRLGEIRSAAKGVKGVRDAVAEIEALLPD